MFISFFESVKIDKIEFFLLNDFDFFNEKDCFGFLVWVDGEVGVFKFCFFCV